MENAILTMYYGMFMANFYIAHNLNLHSVLNVDTLQVGSIFHIHDCQAIISKCDFKSKCVLREKMYSSPQPQ